MRKYLLRRLQSSVEVNLNESLWRPSCQLISDLVNIFHEPSQTSQQSFTLENSSDWNLFGYWATILKSQPTGIVKFHLQHNALCRHTKLQIFISVGSWDGWVVPHLWMKFQHQVSNIFSFAWSENEASQISWKLVKWLQVSSFPFQFLDYRNTSMVEIVWNGWELERDREEKNLEIWAKM